MTIARFAFTAVFVMGSAVMFGCASVTDRSAAILWSEAQHGLSLEIERPSSAFVFEPVKGWTGPLLVHPGPGLTTSNRGGKWSKEAIMKVFVRNTSDHVIWWSEPTADDGVWCVTVFRSGAPEPQEWIGPKPGPERNGPVALAPGAQKEIHFNLNEGGDIWPLMPTGQYTVAVSYSPDRLLTYARGSEGDYKYPYEVPGFWTGAITTPEVHRQVVYP